MRILAVGVFLVGLALSAVATTIDSLSTGLEVNIRGGYAFNSNAELMNRLQDSPETKEITHQAISAHMQYFVKGLGDESCKSVRQGIGIGFTSFNAPSAVGNPWSAYVLQSVPMLVFDNKLSMDYEWNFGVSAGWHPSSSGYNLRSNLVVGSAVNAYINLGFKMVWEFSPGWTFGCGFDLSHYSNGNTSWPNPGVNTLGFRMGVGYIVSGKKSERQKSPFGVYPEFARKMVYDVMAFGAWRKSYFPYERAGFDTTGELYLLPGHFGVAGLNVSPLWWFHPRFRIGASADFQWSGCNALIYENYWYKKPGVGKQLTLGLSARAELVMPVFTVNVGLGYGVIGSYETRKFYQTINLKTYLYKGAYLNVGYRLHRFRSPSNLMLGVGYTIGG